VVAPDLPRLNPQVELTLFRAIQESLANVLRHTKSPSAEIRLERSFGEIKLEVADAGGGADPGELRHPGVGIAGMRERLAQVGGTLTFNYDPHGSTICARIPLL
jgi:signal transduction histidine kinase